jgi:DNA-binding response OmpR family regulator
MAVDPLPWWPPGDGDVEVLDLGFAVRAERERVPEEPLVIALRVIGPLVRAARAQGCDTPVLVLTARTRPIDRVTGLDTGADDYLVKPFDFDELKARVRALLRRDAGRSGALLRVGDIELDSCRHDGRRDGRPLRLTPKEFALLRYFMSRAGQVLSQEDLLEHVWDENADPFTNTVRVTVMTLRRKLADAGDSQPIETVVGRGYRLREQP